MKTKLTHAQIAMMIENATRERNAAVWELVAALPRKALAWAARGVEKVRQIRAINPTAAMKPCGGSASL